MKDTLIAAEIRLPHEPMGIVLVERIEELGAEFDITRKRWPIAVRYAARQIDRPAAGSRLSEVADLIADAIGLRSSKERLTLLVNITACGRPPIDLLTERRLRPIPIVTTQSNEARRGRGSIHVPAKTLITQLSILLGERRLLPFGGVAGDGELAAQLRAFREKPKPKGPLEPWREEETGELVMALALAVWWGETRLPMLTKQPPPPRLPFEPDTKLTFDRALAIAKRERTRTTRL